MHIDKNRSPSIPIPSQYTRTYTSDHPNNVFYAPGSLRGSYEWMDEGLVDEKTKNT